MNVCVRVHCTVLAAKDDDELLSEMTPPLFESRTAKPVQDLHSTSGKVTEASERYQVTRSHHFVTSHSQ